MRAPQRLNKGRSGEYRSRCNLTDGYSVEQLSLSEPMQPVDQISLKEREQTPNRFEVEMLAPFALPNGLRPAMLDHTVESVAP